MNYPKGNWTPRFHSTNNGGDHLYFIEMNPNARFNDAGEYLCLSGLMTEDTANLLSAAPEMYEAIKLLIRSDQVDALNDPVVSQLVYAIEKAEGKLKEKNT